ncbi:hydantoinase B/oxoprolinase family protein [Flavisphingomonas formosensis]|uniref:hydantoinase B/oxoprolinase family protein n=1 Tax=Flavisphingomonas formosensis TaxID=861534 RepID=UPI0018E00855|nr:hydantoinase B/oxoprolinase family protein [Sphingomonas formosensis]
MSHDVATADRTMRADMAAESVPDGAGRVTWDGRFHSYRPKGDWLSRVSGDLMLHDACDATLDPVTFEVIRNRLWMINIAHGETLTRISGSPVFQSLDFNMCLLTEHAEIAMNAPYLQNLGTGTSLAIRYIMEQYSEAPGIHEDDIYVSTDPWIGAVHQMDVMLIAPVFVDGKLFAWVTNAGHQYDRGGVVPGGWPQNAPDVYSDPTILKPFKLVEKGAVRKDLEAMYLRQSRMPDLLALDLRAQIAGCRFAVRQMRDLCTHFGAGVVKAAMRRVIDNAQQSMRDKLSRIPDGRWSQVRYFDERMPGDRSSYRVQVNLTKKGDRLIVDNEGTDTQVEGPLNFVFAAFAGQFLGVVAVTMLYEQMFSTGGAERQIDFEMTPGLISCADYPAAISGGVMSVVVHTNALMQAIGAMLACVPELKSDVIAAGPGWPMLVLAGSNDAGGYFGTALMDAVAMGSGARSNRDGVDTGGATWSPLMKLLNAEEVEQFYPIVYLYRRELEDSAGAGRYRGGVGMKFAFTPYRAREISAITNTGGQDNSTHGAAGLFGGWPSPTCHYLVRKGTNLAEMFARRQMPSAIGDLASEEDHLLRGKSNGTVLRTGDVVEGTFMGGGGYGDPLLREPEAVARDVAMGYVSADAATRIYGVMRTADGAADPAATEACRHALREKRKQWKAAGPGGRGARITPASGEPPRLVHEYVAARDEGGQRVLACAICGHVLGDYTGNYKEGLLVNIAPVTDIPMVGDPALFIDEPVEFRQYCCPGCQTQMATDVMCAREPIFAELTLL